MYFIWHHKKIFPTGLGHCLTTLLLLISMDVMAETAWESQSQPPGLTVHLNSLQSPLPLNQMHQWEIHIEDDQGNPVEMAEIIVTGGMPEHDHGLATAPRVTRSIGEGKYLLEGLRFHMPGLWKLDFTITVNNQRYLVEQVFTL